MDRTSVWEGSDLGANPLAGLTRASSPEAVAGGGQSYSDRSGSVLGNLSDAVSAVPGAVGAGTTVVLEDPAAIAMGEMFAGVGLALTGQVAKGAALATAGAKTAGAYVSSLGQHQGWIGPPSQQPPPAFGSREWARGRVTAGASAASSSSSSSSSGAAPIVLTAAAAAAGFAIGGPLGAAVGAALAYIVRP